jgi:hypothetical protein
MIYKALHRKLKIEQHEPHNKAGVNSGAPEELTVIYAANIFVMILEKSKENNYH